MTSEGLRGATHGISISRLPERVLRVPRVRVLMDPVIAPVMAPVRAELNGETVRAGAGVAEVGAFAAASAAAAA
ncbi:hypothetical protein Pen01_11120 [Phytomonospora endophytica]|nr:hypothetical protein Pen01_11120 [Phytomonospora endophytica]